MKTRHGGNKLEIYFLEADALVILSKFSSAIKNVICISLVTVTSVSQAFSPLTTHCCEDDSGCSHQSIVSVQISEMWSSTPGVWRSWTLTKNYDQYFQKFNEDHSKLLLSAEPSSCFLKEAYSPNLSLSTLLLTNNPRTMVSLKLSKSSSIDLLCSTY